MDVDYILKVCTDDSCVLYTKSLDKYMTMSAAEAKVLISYLGEDHIEFRGDKRAIYERDNLSEETAEALINRFKSLLAAKPRTDHFRKRIFCLPITIPQSYKNNKHVNEDQLFRCEIAILAIALLLSAILIGLLVTNNMRFKLTPTNKSLLLVQVIGAIIVSLVLHEIGHVMVFHKLGGKTTKIGLTLYYFVPTIFCDVSEAYLSH